MTEQEKRWRKNIYKMLYYELEPYRPTHAEYWAKEITELIMIQNKEAGFVLLAEDQSFPAFISLGGISEMELITVMRQADWDAGWRKVLLEGK